MANTGRIFEREVARTYESLGAQNVKQNVNIAGHQIDVYAEAPTIGNVLIRLAISCKDYAGAAGVPDIREHETVVRMLKDGRHIDKGVIVSRNGFTQDAHQAAADIGMLAIEYATLKGSDIDLSPYVERQGEQIAGLPVFRDQYYINLRLRRHARQARDADEIIDEFLDDPKRRRLCVLADFGAGKTTLLRHTFLRLAGQCQSGRSGCWPILVTLRDFAHNVNVQSLITDLVQNQYGARIPSFGRLAKLSKDDGCVLLLDAFDEMQPAPDDTKVAQNSNALVPLLEHDCKIIMTSRTPHFASRRHQTQVLEETVRRRPITPAWEMVSVEPLSPQEVETYIRKAAGGKADEWLAFIRKTYNLQELSRRPILLEMIVTSLPKLIDTDTDVSLASIYAAYTDDWLQRDAWRASLSVDQRKQFTHTFAKRIYADPVRTELDEDTIKQTLVRAFPYATPTAITAYLYDMRSCAFITRLEDADSFRFVHKSFLEYFVASSIFEGIVSDNLDVMRGSAITVEVLGFLASHPRTQQTDATLSSWAKRRLKGSAAMNILMLCAAWELAICGTLEDCTIEDAELPKLLLNGAKIKNVQCGSASILSMSSKEAQIDGLVVVSQIKNWTDHASSVRLTVMDTLTIVGDNLNETHLRVEGRNLHFKACRLTGVRANINVEHLTFDRCDLDLMQESVLEVRRLQVRGGSLRTLRLLARCGGNVTLDSVRLRMTPADVARELASTADTKTRLVMRSPRNLDSDLEAALRDGGVAIQLDDGSGA